MSERFVLAEVPKVGFYSGGDQCPEDIPFPSCLGSALRYMGEDYGWTDFTDKGKAWRLNHTYIEIVAASGMAFGLRWKDGWYQDNADMMFVADPEEVIRRAFDYVGYGYHAVEKREDSGDKERFYGEIRDSLQSGKPVLGFGVVGPPECGLVTGYDDSGEVLVGWSFFQAMPPFNLGLDYEPAGYYRKTGWLNDTWSLVVIDGKTARQDPHQRTLDILHWALTVGRSPIVLGRHTGLAAYDAWARQILNDADFSTDDERVHQSRHEIHNSAVGVVAECRWGASEFLKMVAPGEPVMSADLLAAAASFRKEHDLMWQAWDLVGGNGNPQSFSKFASTEVRRQMSSIIQQARREDERALNSIGAALEKQPGR